MDTNASPLREQGLRAATLFGWLSAVFVALSVLIVAWLVIDQKKLLDDVTRLRTQSLPQSVEQQRLARNLETLRLEGERVLAARDVQGRQQAMFVVSLMASHPSILSHPRARDVATETELFLSRAAASIGSDAALRAEWQQLSPRLSLAADDISVEGVSLARSEAAEMGEVIEAAQRKLYGALALTVLFIAILLFLLHRRLVQPLQQVDHALSHLREKQPMLDLPPSALHEIRAIEGAILQLHDVLQEHEKTREELERLAATDMLTGLNNRRNFMSLASGEVARAQRYGRPITVALADLDHFKRINDEHGHEAGDIALKSFAGLVRGTLRHADIAGRYGGEEFAFVFPETTPQEAAVLSNRLRRRLEESGITLPNGETIALTLSIGLSDAATLSLEEALRIADHALYQAKAGGRNAVVLAPAAGISIIPPDSDEID